MTGVAKSLTISSIGTAQRDLGGGIGFVRDVMINDTNPLSTAACTISSVASSPLDRLLPVFAGRHPSKAFYLITNFLNPRLWRCEFGRELPLADGAMRPREQASPTLVLKTCRRIEMGHYKR